MKWQWHGRRQNWPFGLHLPQRSAEDEKGFGDSLHLGCEGEGAQRREAERDWIRLRGTDRVVACSAGAR